MKLFNKSKLRVESAKKQKCPRCSGFGGCFPADDGEPCSICKGDGRVWMSETGWTRPLYGRIGESEQLW